MDGNTDAILEIVKSGDLKNLKAMMARGLDLKRHKLTLLQNAAKYNNQAIVEFLLIELYATSNAEDMGFPLHAAIVSGSVECVQTILKHKPELLNARNSDGIHPIRMAAQKMISEKNNEIFNHLVDAGADLNVTSKGNWTILHFIALFGDLTGVPCVLKKSSDVNALNDNGCTALFLAAGIGKVENVKLLLDNGADPKIIRNDDSNEEISPLTAAVQRGHFEVVKILADVTPQEFEHSAVTEATMEKNYTCLQYLLEKGFTAPERILNYALFVMIRNSSQDLSGLIKILFGKGVSFSDLLEKTNPAEIFLMNKNSFVMLCNLGLVEFEMSPELRTRTRDNITNCLAGRIETMIIASNRTKLLRNLAIYLKYYPFLVPYPDFVTFESMIPAVPKLTELCRWNIRCCFVQLHEFVSTADIRMLPLPNALKNFLYFGQYNADED